MAESTNTQLKNEIEAGHAGAHAAPAGHSTMEERGRGGILFLLILTVVTVIGFAGLLYRVFSTGG
jgi:hypothetical protein